MNKKYIVTLTEAERDQLCTLISCGKAAARKLLHARILLKADATTSTGPNLSDMAISVALEVSRPTIARVRQQFMEQGLEAALERRLPSIKATPLLDGEAEAHLVALACSAPPDGRKRWTIRLLASRMIELNYVPTVGRETVRRTLKKTNLNLG